MSTRPSLLKTAIERRDWETAAVVLLLGVVEAARKLPPGALEEMIEALSAEGPPRPRRPTRRRRGRR